VQTCPHVSTLLERLQAAQAVEPAALIPLQMLKPDGKVVLVGDPKQLPATVVSRAADKAGLSRSMFERLQQVPCSKPLPLIASFQAAFSNHRDRKVCCLGAGEQNRSLCSCCV
jgi:hypothetical protein